MNALGWLVLGLLAGWVIEFAIDFLYWRRKALREAEALAQKEASILAQQTELGHRQSTMRMREREMSDLQASLASRDAELLQQARRIEARDEDLSRLEQLTEKRRADLDRMGLSLNEREKEIAARGDQLRSRESDYNRRLDTLESTEQELARRVAVVGNREEAMQSWEGRILSREHDVADREASVNYHAGRIASDAGAFDAVKHLLGRHHRPEGRDNLQALVGIDADTDALLRKAGIDGFERLAETPLGELTRILQAAGPQFALVNPLSWAEQATYVLDSDYVALDRLQSELLGIRRESVGDALLAAMLKKQPGAAAVAAEDSAEARTEEGSGVAVNGASAEDAGAVPGAVAGVAAAVAAAAGAAQSAEARTHVATAETAVEESAASTGEAVASGAAASETAVAGTAAAEADVATGEDSAEDRPAVVEGATAAGATDGAVAADAGEAVSDEAVVLSPDEASDAPQAVWASDAGDEGEGSGVYATAVAVERIEAVAVEDDGQPHWPGAGGDVSDAVVLGEQRRSGEVGSAGTENRVSGY